MAEYRFSMIIDGVEHVSYRDIPDSEIHAALVGTIYAGWYRQNQIEKELRKWALSKLILSYEEVTDDGKGNSDHSSKRDPTGQEAQEAE